MPTIFDCWHFDILRLITLMLSWVEHEKSLITSGPVLKSNIEMIFFTNGFHHVIIDFRGVHQVYMLWFCSCLFIVTVSRCSRYVWKVLRLVLVLYWA